MAVKSRRVLGRFRGKVLTRLRQGDRVAVMRRDFDPAWYVQMYPDVAREHSEPFKHYLVHGWAEDRAPNARIWRLRTEKREGFDAAWYVGEYPDVASAGVDPLEYYLTTGKAKKHAPNIHLWRMQQLVRIAFDPDWYLEKYPDIASNGVDPLEHYLNDGRQEGRFPTLDGARAAAWVNTFGVR